jgi:predicted TIM-barrel fold metal-dependent hydrolase
MEIIDGHAHACGMFLNSDNVVKYLNKNNISKIVLSAGEPNSTKVYSLPYLAKIFKNSALIYFNNMFTALIISLTKMNTHIDEGNEKVALMAEEYPQYIMNTYWINPLEKNCIDKMEEFRKQHSFYMLKVHQCWTNFDINDSGFSEVVEWAQRNSMPLFIHLKSKDQVKKLISLIKEHPKLTIIIAHLIGIEEFDNTIGENVFFDISCPLLHSVKMLKLAFDTFGPDRIILGSDAPYGADNINLAISQLHEVGIDDNEIEHVCSKNIQKIFASNLINK